MFGRYIRFILGESTGIESFSQSRMVLILAMCEKQRSMDKEKRQNCYAATFFFETIRKKIIFPVLNNSQFRTFNLEPYSAGNG